MLVLIKLISLLSVRNITIMKISSHIISYEVAVICPSVSVDGQNEAWCLLSTGEVSSHWNCSSLLYCEQYGILENSEIT